MVMTQKSLARLLDISEMAVSRALRGHDGVGDTLRNRILEQARLHGVNRPRSRPRPATRHGVVCTVVTESVMDDQTGFHRRLLSGLSRGILSCGSEAVNVPGLNGAWPLIVTRGQVDGLIFVHGDDAPLPRSPCPVPKVGIFFEDPGTDEVTVDNYAGGFMLGKYLWGKGHRRVGFIGPETRLARERMAGFRSAFEMHGVEIPRQHMRLSKRYGMDTGAVAMTDELLGGGTQPLPVTALMYYNDYMAGCAIPHLHACGIRIPDDLSVVGFDGVSQHPFSGPALTTCAIPLEQLGSEAAQLLYWRLDAPKAPRRKLVLAPTLIEGESVTSPGEEAPGASNAGQKMGDERV